MSTISASDYNAQFRDISNNHTDLKTLIKAKGEAFTLFSRAIQLQHQVKALVESNPKNAGSFHLQASIQKTITSLFKRVDPTCLSEEQKTELEEEDKYVRFSSHHTCPYSNSYNYRLRFGGTYYLNAESCLLKHANENDIMMRVLRAKFGQNRELKKMLISTGNAYLVCHGSDPVLSDAFDGTGQNELGKRLMRLRGEYTGKGEVSPNISYQIMTQVLRRTSPFGFPMELAGQLFLNLGIRDIFISAQVNKCWNRAIAIFLRDFFRKENIKENLEKVCYPTLTILDAKTQGIEIKDEPPIDLFEVFNWVLKAGPCVEGDEGLTVLTLEQGVTFNQLKKEASDAGITIIVFHDISPEELQDDVFIEHTRRVPLANNILLGSRNKSPEEQLDLLKEIDCEMAEHLELLALCIRIFKKYGICCFKDKPHTYGRTSTELMQGETFFIVGNSNSTQIKLSHDSNLMCKQFGSSLRGKFGQRN